MLDSKSPKQLTPFRPVPTAQNSKVENITRGISSVLTGSPEDIRLLEIFYVKCLPIIPGHTKSKIWTTLIPQMSQTEPVIWHAMLAVASLFEHTEVLGTPIYNSFLESNDVVISRPKAIAISHYTKALRGMQQQLGSSISSSTIVLTACIIFTCIEALRGNTKAALAHIENGSNILKDFPQKDERGAPSDHEETALSLGGDIKDSLLYSFTRLRILSSSIQEYTQCTASKGSFSGALANCPPDMKFETLDEARYAQGRIMKNAALVVYGATQEGRGQTTFPSGPDAAVASRIQVDAQLRQWTNAFDSFMKGHSRRRRDIESKQPKSGFVILRFFAKLCSIRLWVSFLPQGPALNAMAADFKEVLDLAEECTVLQSRDVDPMSGKTNQPPLFIMDMGVLPGLFFVACKCPDLSLRWRAIEMLERTPRREALWCSVTAARTARSVLETGTTWPGAI